MSPAAMFLILIAYVAAYFAGVATAAFLMRRDTQGENVNKGRNQT